MSFSTPANSEHQLYFQAFQKADSLADFLLVNRLQRVLAEQPMLTSLRVVIQGATTVKPHHVTTLACLLEEYQRAGITIVFEPIDSVVFAYLRSIGFLTRWEQPSEQENFQLLTDSTFFALWQAEPEQLNAYVTNAYQHYQAGYFAGKDLSFLTTYLAELFNNIFDHAFASGIAQRPAFGMLQYYPSRKRLFIAVSDFGMGIPNSVNQFLQRTGQEPVIAAEALRKALTFRFTSQSKPYNQGRGLDTLRTGLRQLRGTLTIQTAYGIYHVSEDGREFYKDLPNTNFPGTTVSIRLLHDNLPAEETETLEDDVALF